MTASWILADLIVLDIQTEWESRPDQNHFYLTESWAFIIHRFVYDEQTGTIADRETFVQHTQEEAFEQGLDGPAGSLFRHAPDGTRVHRVDVPADNVTSLTIGGLITETPS